MIDIQKFNLAVQSHLHKADVGSSALQLSPIQVNQEYLNEWNNNNNDFVCLTKNGELISKSLYRVGGFGVDIKQDYFLLLKYVESFYEIDFLKGCYPKKSRKEIELHRKYLKGCWCIIDKNGVEKKEFEQFTSPYIINDSRIYSINQKYYNIETDEFYCESYKSIESSEFLFLDNHYDKDPSKKGVMKINKKDGSWTIFS